ncbi:dimethylaniline monooxygenase 2 [Colletotrichum truncatum]|uniref:Dimethylaniline monooxygenase 2 n=1 Tax=Colletotrichum truncatum TaxID=5467 RepID=A0ACC3YEY7_COLTU|nr:dimethylaniline monooxygenase 2 [Colletotrichum truncatum]KAF6784965.1 dimethylaniline monooxygenase 2 [Colletotrichum truncatum]
MRTPATIAVIGAGPGGLSALKELREVGFDVTLFERRSDVGGLWTYSDDPSVTSTTAWTKSQISNFISSMSDFPFPDHYPPHVSATEWSDYYKMYAKHFDLYRNIIFNAVVELIERDTQKRRWLVHIAGEGAPRPFDKVVLASGSETKPHYPHIENLNLFEGQFMHSQAYKGPENLKDKKVVVIGVGNTACDIAVELTDYASKVYLSHRRGAKVIPRMNGDGPIDSVLSWRTSRLGHWLEHHFPSLYSLSGDLLFKKNAKELGEQDPKWGFEPSPSIGLSLNVIVVNDDIFSRLREGRIESVKGATRILGPHAVEVDDGNVIEDVDVIIAATGYRPDFSLVPELSHTRASDSKLPPLPELYQNIFAVDFPDSLACTSYCTVNDNAASYRELQSMAIAQVWTGNSSLPSQAEMRQHITTYQKWLWRRFRDFPATPLGSGQPHSWMRFVHEMAGTGMYEYLGWGWKGWKFWWQDRNFYRLVAWGAYSPHMYRMFETGKRRMWPGAKEAIIKANRDRDRMFPKAKEKSKTT